MALLIMMPDRDVSELVAHLSRLDSDLDVRVWPDHGDPDDVELVVPWRHPPGSLLAYPNLRVVCSFGAGVDHVLPDDRLPTGVEVARIVDDDLVRDMAEYVLTALLTHFRHWRLYLEQQRHREWRPVEYSRRRRVVVLGLGRLGGATARLLAKLGFAVTGWSRTERELQGVTCISGPDALHTALPEADAVVCMLPLTDATRGLLAAPLFARMKSDSLLVNVARGAHLVEPDLLAALDQGRPVAAYLDVFDHEPLPPDHALWSHPAITVTPHVASLTNQAAAAARLVERYRRMRGGAPLPGPVDLGRGY